MISWKRIRLVAFERKKNRNNKKIIPMYLYNTYTYAILNECTFSVLYKDINKYIFFILNNYMHLKT